MNLKVGIKLCGFTINRVRNINELKGLLVEMTHDKTGAELCWMNNGEQNKLFSVAFKTLPEDSTGVFHILEHSVLCGSEKYPVKEPFVELLKSSMNTFLNAMTYPDKTVYPVSSRNEKDFLNLISVYLDAVFVPRIIDDPNIFYQEGIHTELKEEGPSYKGVVFNEMKGAMSNVDDRIEQGINRLLFPDSCYRFNFGGDPAVIPDLTYEQLVDTYQRFYHPSNALFFLDGDIPLETTLEIIDSYLKTHDKNNELPELSMQNPVSNEGTEQYEISADENSDKKAILTLGKIIGSWEDKTRLFAAKVLCDVLADSNESPLKRAILSSSLADDVEMIVMDGIAQPYLLMVVRNMKDSDSNKIHEIIRNTAEQLISEGIDKKSLSASINRLSFRSKQKSEPQGLYRAISALDGWLYGGDPLTHLICDETFEALRNMTETDAFEQLLEELLIKKDGLAVLHMLPSKTLGIEERQTEEKRLKAEISALTDKQVSELTLQNKRLLLWQQTPDLAEATATLPILSLNEVNVEPETIQTVETQENGVTLLYHPISTYGIVYLSMYFPLTNFSLAELTELSLLSELFGEFPTEKHSVIELQQEIKTYIGSLRFSLEAFAENSQTDRCTPYLAVRAGILEENLSVAKALISEILTESRFDDSDKIKEIVMQSYEISKQTAIGSGHSLGVGAVQAHYSAKSAVNEAISGYTALKFLHDFAERFDDMVDEFISLIDRVKTTAISRSGLTVSVTATENISMNDLLTAIPDGTPLPKDAVYQTKLPMRMGIRIPAQITFAVKGYHLSACGMKMTGSLRIVSNIILLAYLWNAVRVQGGAYGVGFPVRRDGGIMCYSYRDPSPVRSLKIYDTLAEFIREFCDSDEALDKYIISAVSATEPLRTPAEQGIVADEFYFSGVTEADRRLTRRQMLSVSRKDLTDWCLTLEKMAEQGAVCVIGHDEALRECEDLEIFEL